MIYYVNLNKKRLVGRNNNVTSRPLTLEYDVTEVIDFQFIDDNNQIQPLLPETAGLTLAIGLKQNMPSYDLLALSHDYEIVNGQTLRFTVNTYTVNWLKKINKPNTEVFIEISQQSLESKKVWMRDYCYVWPRVYTAGLEPEEIASNDYYTKAETDEAIENAISGIVISGYVTEEQLEEGLATKQNVIDADNKLDYDLLSGTPTIPTKTSDLDNDSGFITEDALSGYATETALSTHTSDTTIHVTAEDKETWNGKQDAITVDNKLDYALLSGTPEVPTVEWGGISGTLSAQTDLQNALNAKANTSDIPLSTSQLTNDSNFVTSSEMDDALSGKQDLITESEWLPATYVRMDIDHWQGDPDFDVAAAVNMTRDDVYAVSGVLSGKQDAITNDNKLDYALLSGTPTIPLSTSQLTNDSDFQTSTDVANAISGKAEQTDVDAISGELEEVDEMLQYYIEEYDLLHTPFYVETLSANNYIKFNHMQNAPNVNLKYSYDNENWYDYTIGTDLEMTNVGDRIYFKGNNTALGDRRNYKYNNLSSTYDINVGGNTNSLLNESMKVKQLNESALFALFYNATKLVDASKLMLPVKNLAYGCYTYMFAACSSLKKAPYMLLAENPAELCYEAMFYLDTQLTNAPIIKLKTLTGGCLNNLFNNCSMINKIEVHFTDWLSQTGQNTTNNWVTNVASSGTFYCPSGLDTTTRNVNRVPANWTVVNI